MFDITSIKINPKNPRTITPESLQILEDSLRENIDGLDANKIVHKDGIVIAGNQRLKILLKLIKEGVPGIEPKDNYFKDVSGWTDKQVRRYLISSNVASGEWDYDMLGDESEWDKSELAEWGVEFNWEEPTPELSDDYSQKLGEIIYEPKETHHKVADLYKPEHKFDEDIEKIQNKELQAMFHARSFNFVDFNFEKLADYYAYQATPEEQRLFEKLALVLIDKDKLIELGFSNLLDKRDLTEEEYDNEIE